MVFYHPNNDSFLAAWPPVGGILWLGRNEEAELPQLCGRVDSGHAARVNKGSPPLGRDGAGRGHHRAFFFLGLTAPYKV